MNQDGTKTALLRAGLKSFARHGFEGASVREITSAAHANLGAITYHFGSKRRLYEEVLATATAPLADSVVGASQAPGTVLEQVEGVIRAYFNFLIDHHEVGQLMLQELVLGKTPETTVLPVQRIHMALTQLVMRGQASGEFRSGDPRLLVFGIISQPVHMSLLRRPLKVIAGVDLQDAQTREQIIHHVTAFAIAGLGNTKL